MRHDKRNWLYWAAPLMQMITFTIVAVSAILERNWWWVIVGAAGIITSGLLWNTIQTMRARVLDMQRGRVTDAYKLGELQKALARERAWKQ